MPAVHRNGDVRECSALTVVSGQSTVYVNGVLAAVEGDLETHGAGALVSSSAGTVLIDGIPLIVVSDTALSDGLAHLPPSTDPSQGSPDVSAY